MDEKYHTFAAFLLIQAMFWVWEALRHRSEKFNSKLQQLNAPKWLRGLFGDFRAEGKLDPSATLLQVLCYVIIIVALFLLWRSNLTRDIVVSLSLLQLFLIGIVTFVVEIIIPRLFK